MPPPGLDNLKHLVVLMMENRSFDHMLGGLRETDPRIDGLTGAETNPDPAGTLHKVESKAKYQSQLDPDPNHDFAPVHQQIFNGGPVGNMQGFVNSYFEERRDVDHARQIMYYFKPDKLPVLKTLAQEYAVFNGWFSSIPGPTLCNRAFAHYGTSFGHVGMELFYANAKFKSIYQRLEAAGRTAKIYFFDQISSTMEIVNLIQDQPQFFATFDQFLRDCENGQLPDYSFVEPNYSDHDGSTGQLIASDQHPDHHVLEGERYIAAVYNAIRTNPALWGETAILITYDEHGGIYDHVVPPACMPDGEEASADATKIGQPFRFDRLGVRVPAVFVSPWVPRGTVVDAARVFEHASIPATATKWLLPNFPANERSPREAAAETFLDLMTLPQMRPENECPMFQMQRARQANAARRRANVINVRRTPKSAFNKRRPLSGLLKAQIRILESAAGVRRKLKPKTEGSAAKYIASLSARVHGVAAPAEVAPRARAVPPASRRAAPKARVKRKPAAKRQEKRARKRAAARTTRKLRPRRQRVRRTKRRSRR